MTQVTVRKVDEAWVARAKAIAAEKGVSMNAVLREAIRTGLGMDGPKRTNGLEKFAGDSANLFDAGFDEAMKECSQINPLDWE